MMFTRRTLFGLVLLPALPRVSAPQEWEVRGFSVYAGPDMLEMLLPGVELNVAIRGEGTGWLTGMVFARERQVGYLETTPHDTSMPPMPDRLVIARVERSANGRHRLWAHATER
jgi:hypothetical protein